MPGTAIHQVKSELRITTRRKRQQISVGERAVLDRAINLSIIEYVRKTGVESLAAFWPFDGEPDIRPALRELASSGIAVALPVLEPGSDATFSLHQWQIDSLMVENSFQIAEPVNEPQIDTRTLDIMLIPLVAWDRNGGRLGMGAGYYDRQLEVLRSSEVPLRLGLAYALQEVSAVPVEPNDVPMHGVLCEHGWMVFGV